MPRPQSWVLAHNEASEWSVLHGGRPVDPGPLTRDEAVAKLQQHHSPGERVYIAEPDGYRREVTGEMVKAGLIPPRVIQNLRVRPASFWAARARTVRAARLRREEVERAKRSPD